MLAALVLAAAVVTSSAPQFELAPGVEIKAERLVEQHECWPSTWTDREREAMLEQDAFKLRRYLQANWGDWYICVVYLERGVSVGFGPGSVLAFDFGDKTVRSVQMAASDGPLELELRTNVGAGIVFSSADPPMTRSGGYLLLVRFPEGSIPRDGAPTAIRRVTP